MTSVEWFSLLRARHSFLLNGKMSTVEKPAESSCATRTAYLRKSTRFLTGKKFKFTMTTFLGVRPIFCPSLCRAPRSVALDFPDRYHGTGLEIPNAIPVGGKRRSSLYGLVFQEMILRTVARVHRNLDPELDAEFSGPSLVLGCGVPHLVSAACRQGIPIGNFPPGLFRSEQEFSLRPPKAGLRPGNHR